MRAVDEARRSLQALSAEALSLSKRAIFAFHRDDPAKAATDIEAARERLRAGKEIVAKESRIAQEGSWRAAQEEFAEADLLRQYLTSGKIGAVKDVSDDPDIFLGAASDLAGELVRRAVTLASHGKDEEVHKIVEDMNELVEFLLQMDLTGGLRTKVDQAKQHLRKLEEIQYDLAMRRR